MHSSRVEVQTSASHRWARTVGRHHHREQMTNDGGNVEMERSGHRRRAQRRVSDEYICAAQRLDDRCTGPLRVIGESPTHPVAAQACLVDPGVAHQPLVLRVGPHPAGREVQRILDKAESLARKYRVETLRYEEVHAMTALSESIRRLHEWCHIPEIRPEATTTRAIPTV